jgi:hypothetical protein
MRPTVQDIADLTNVYEAKYAANMKLKYTDFPWQEWLAQHQANTVCHQVFHLLLTTETYNTDMHLCPYTNLLLHARTHTRTPQKRSEHSYPCTYRSWARRQRWSSKITYAISGSS